MRRGTTSIRPWLAAPAMLLLSAGAIAAEPGASGGLPQLNPATFAPQLFWAAVMFGLLYLLMSRVALPKVGAVLDERARRIGDDLEQAARMQQEAEASLAAYEKALTEARVEAHAISAKMSDDLARLSTEAQTSLANEIAAQTRDAEGRIAAARETALEQVRSIASDTTREAAMRLAGVDVTAERAGAAVQAVQEKP